MDDRGGRNSQAELSETIDIVVTNRSGIPFDEEALAALCRRVLGAEGVDSGELGLTLVAADEIAMLKRDHLGIEEATDVLSFPIDSRERLPAGVPRQLGDVVLCPDVTGPAWQWPLVHGLLHLLGYEHGDEMARREEALLA